MAEGWLPLPIMCAILGGVLRGLHAAHEAKNEEGLPLHIVHRDVSPQNILVGVDGVARILDFGVAKAVGRLQSTHDGRLKGKLAYMAPEQIHGDHLDRRSDVFAAGVVLWEALTGQRLFRDENDAVTITKVLGDPVAPPSRTREGIPAALDDVVIRALDRQPSRRFATAHQMACALEAPRRTPEAGVDRERDREGLAEPASCQLLRRERLSAELLPRDELLRRRRVPARRQPLDRRRENFVTGLRSSGDSHNEAATIRDFRKNAANTRSVKFIDNRLDCSSGNVTGGLFIQPTWVDIFNVTVQGNYIEGGGYNLYVDQGPSGAVMGTCARSTAVSDRPAGDRRPSPGPTGGRRGSTTIATTRPDPTRRERW
jgi:serine/threonine protein kinase